MNVTLIGCGLIGGSMVLDMRKAGMIQSVTGIDSNPDHLKAANRRNIIDRQGTVETDISGADLVILAVPVDAAKEIIIDILDYSGSKTVIMDVGSTKAGICKSAGTHPNRNRFVATHPIAGTEYSGPESSFLGLFENKIALICESEMSSSFALERVKNIYDILGSKITEMDSVEHDRHLAYVSHLSHISSFTLGLTVLDIEKNEKNISMLAGSGFESTVRLAKSSPEMWGPIFIQNASDIKKALDEYIRHLNEFGKMIATGEKQKLRDQMKKANEIIGILNSGSDTKK